MTLAVYEPTPEEFEEHTLRVQPVPRGQSVKYAVSKTDPTYFAVNSLRFKPYTFQSKTWDYLAGKSDVALCTARQIGKTALIAVYSLWACYFNTIPLDTTKKTRIVIVSATEEQSKKIISDIREFIRMGDEHVFQTTAKATKEGTFVGGRENFFTDQLDNSKAAANNKGAITFKNGCEIISLPPTERARGYTASMVFIDEAAYIEKEDIYESTIKNLVAKTGGQICMTSTPNGQQGFFFKYFDPDDALKDNYYKRLWLPYTSMRLDDPKLVEKRDGDKNTALLLGNERQFDQEHMASFISTTASFFDSEKIDAAVSEKMEFLTSSKAPCDMGIDFGVGKVSRHSISISRLEKGGRIRLVYEYEYKIGEEDNILDDLIRLKEKFNVQRIIPEECPAGFPIIQKMERMGWNIHPFNPTSRKADKYFAFRSWLHQGKVVMPYTDETIKQMKALQLEEGVRNTKIHHGAGIRDDRIDSFMMSTIFFTAEKPTFRVWDWDDI